MADRTIIEDIKANLDIAEVVREYVSLKRSGNNEFGLCPFHHEKSPSFSVNSSMGVYKCFGCGESGDVISFLQKIEGLDFPEALKLAAEKAGIKIKNDFPSKDSSLELKKEKIIEINKFAAKFFNFVLLKHPAGENALKYLENRKLGPKAIDQFYLGYAPNRWSSLKDFMVSKGYKIPDLIEAGLLVNKNNKVYDKFRGRVIFPLFNEKGQIIGFAGRILEKNDKAPKYLNSPETVVFNKSHFLFGLYQGKNEIRQKKYCILVEGPTDVINSNQGGITNICAPQGTSLTALQLKLLHRYCDTVYICFDQDDAGQIALRRSLGLAWQEGFNVKVINLEGVKDADELMQKDFEAWRVAIENAQNVIDYFFAKALIKYNAKTVEGKVNIVNDLIPLVSSLKNEVEQASYVGEIAMSLGLDEKIISNQLKSFSNQPDLMKQNLREQIKEESVNASVVEREDYFLALILQSSFIDLKKINNVNNLIFSEGLLQEVFDSIKFLKRKSKDVSSFISSIKNDEIKSKLTDLLMFRIGDKIDDEIWIENEFLEVLELLIRNSLKSLSDKLQFELNATEKLGDSVKNDILLRLSDIGNKTRQVFEFGVVHSDFLILSLASNILPILTFGGEVFSSQKIDGDKILKILEELSVELKDILFEDNLLKTKDVERLIDRLNKLSQRLDKFRKEN